MTAAYTIRDRPYQPFGAARRLLLGREKEIVLSGPAGTGKSRACLEKLHICAAKERYAGMRGLIVRKTRESLTESALYTWESHVVPADHPSLTPVQRRNRQSYSYPNGSQIVVGGMDKPSKIMSTEFDIIFVQEAIELTENDWESLTTRLRHNRMPYQQIIADTNPDAPTHWLRQRADAGRLLMLESRHEDNPTVTVEYLRTLDELTGPRKDRLRYGRWVQAEGVVYEDWNRAIHLVDRFPIPDDWPRYWSVDFGYRDPFVCQFWAKDSDGRLYRYREIYLARRLVEDHARRILVLAKDEPRPRAIVCDHDLEDRMTLERVLHIPTTPAPKDIRRGIQSVASRLKVQGDGKPRLFLLRDSTDERDRELAALHRPCSLEEEMDCYSWDTRAGRKRGEEPLDRDNHAQDPCRYICLYLDDRPAYKIHMPTLDNRTEVERMPAGVWSH